MLKQLKKLGKNKRVKNILTNLFDKIELLGPRAGKLLDSQLFIYEMKVMNPPIRLYYKHNLEMNEIYLFEYEMKTSENKQRQTIDKIRKKVLES